MKKKNTLKIEELLKPIEEAYLKMIKDKTRDETDVIAYRLFDSLHTKIAHCNLIEGMRRYKEKSKIRKTNLKLKRVTPKPKCDIHKFDRSDCDKFRFKNEVACDDCNYKII